MFTNPNPQLPSTSTIHVFPLNSFQDHEKDDHYINHPNRSNYYHNPFLPGDCFPAKENLTTSKHDLVEGMGLQQCDEYNHLFWSEIKKEKPSKKDHHSKIHTAQGPRDRRVRLSTEVAKKFFYLQDLLGVDKASKTLDWLFNKSKISIDELIKVRKKATLQLCSSNQTLQSSFWNSIELLNDYGGDIGEPIREDDISMLCSYHQNPAVLNDLSFKSTCLPRFTDLHHEQPECTCNDLDRLEVQ
ncbi:hypothetical protein E3N88_43333 [Mikania micrantha]|uniref:TCP domain-containing protein n=1 Tax=Mikania micrantha TaxID=192012 RepID=A0A5N6LF74_9ASTR|nr:hypothetical protein E3N88_43333 [Mikania micrantha]